MVNEENYDQRKYMGMRKKLLRRTFDRGTDHQRRKLSDDQLLCYPQRVEILKIDKMLTS